MVLFDHDVLDEMYTDADMNKFRVYYENVEITTAEDRYEGESCCLFTKDEVYGVTLTDGKEIEIPMADVLTFKGIECGA